jgi:aminopeptidase N
MIRVLMYDPKLKNPNARFIAMMHEFMSTFAGQNASTEDFRKVVEKHAGKSMEWFFEQWVYGSETPEYDFSYQLANAEGGQTELILSLTQSKVSESFRMQLPLYVVVNGEQQYLGLIGVIGTKPLKTSIKLPVKPEKVVLDPERNILAEIRQ